MIFIVGLIFNDTITLRDIPDSIIFDLKESYYYENKFLINEEKDIFCLIYYPSSIRSYILKFNKNGEFVKAIGEFGESPEKYHNRVVDLEIKEKLLFIFSDFPGNKVTIYDYNGVFKNGFIIDRRLYYCWRVLKLDRYFYFVGLLWKIGRDKYIMDNFIHKFEVDSLNFIYRSAFFTPKIPSNVFSDGVGRTKLCAGLNKKNKEIWIILPPIPKIHILDLNTEKIKKIIKIKSNLYGNKLLLNPRLAGLKNREEYIKGLKEWFNSMSYPINLYYSERKELWYLNFRNYDKKSEKEIFYIMVLDRNGRIKKVEEVPGPLLYKDEEDNFYFARGEHKILIGRDE